MDELQPTEPAAHGVTCLLELSEDAICGVLLHCPARTLSVLQAVCQGLRTAASEDLPWTAALARDFDVGVGVGVGDGGHRTRRALYRRLATAPSEEIAAHGFLTDGGIDDDPLAERLPQMQEGEHAVWRPRDAYVSSIWVANAFEPSCRSFSSDIGPGGGVRARIGPEPAFSPS